jgi:curved DNA-binding protein CbpA
MNPYIVLDVPFNANDEKIRQAFYKKLRFGDKNEITTAYSLIKDERSRKKFRWLSISSYYADIPDCFEMTSEKMEKIAGEVAFLSEWELGRDFYGSS